MFMFICVLGEILSFYLSRILGLDNVPIVTLSEANSANKQWQGMKLAAAGWNESSIVVLIQWIDGLESER
jgi:four-jointed box protein 1